MRTPESESLLCVGLVARSISRPAGRLASRKYKGQTQRIRNRLRYCIWHDWKKPERRRKNLLRLGVDHQHACSWSRTSMGGWRVAQSPILVTTVTLDRLQQRGYESMLDYYLKVAPQLNEPPPDRTGRAVYVTRTYSRGKGAPHHLQAVKLFTRLCVVFYKLTNVKIALANSAGASWGRLCPIPLTTLLS